MHFVPYGVDEEEHTLSTRNAVTRRSQHTLLTHYVVSHIISCRVATPVLVWALAS